MDSKHRKTNPGIFPFPAISTFSLNVKTSKAARNIKSVPVTYPVSVSV